MFILRFIFGFLMIGISFSGYIEKVVVSGCHSCQLMLTCRQLDSTIAILDADFQPIYEKIENSTSFIFPPDHPRDSLNKRCSGLNHCSFILSEDSPGSEIFGPGNLTVRYACVTADKVQKYCNTEIQLKEPFSSGFIRNPGYPRFYAGQKKCSWKIRAPIHQKLKLKILDVALFDTRVQLKKDCKDTLEIIDSGLIIYSTCSQENPPSEVISASESIEILLSSRQNFNPRRGVLIHYSSLGCPLIPLEPKRAYLVFQNDSLVIFSCCKGYVFPDTQEKVKNIRCIGAFWNVTLPLLDCELPETLSSTNLQEINEKRPKTMASELVAPILLMFLLFAVNGVVVYYIHKARNKQVIDVGEEELGTFTPTATQ